MYVYRLDCSVFGVWKDECGAEEEGFACKAAIGRFWKYLQSWIMAGTVVEGAKPKFEHQNSTWSNSVIGDRSFFLFLFWSRRRKYRPRNKGLCFFSFYARCFEFRLINFKVNCTFLSCLWYKCGVELYTHWINPLFSTL